MIRTLFLAAACILVGLSQAFAQPGSYRERQAAEYKSLSNATQRAFAVPTSTYSPPAYKSSAPYSQSSSTSSSSGSSSGSVSGTSTYYNAFDDGSVARRTAAYEAKLNAREREWQDKMAKVRSFLASSGIVPDTPEKHTQFFMKAYQAGLDVSAINAVIMHDADGYNKAVARANGMNVNYTGSTRKECAGTCTETVTYVNGSGVYTGNTKDGAPHGLGTITLPNGQTITGRFYEGAISGGKVKIFFPARDKDHPAATYEGGYSNNNLNGFGVYKESADYIDEAEYKDGMMNGPCTLTRKNYVETGVWTNSKATGKHTWAYRNGRVVEQMTKEGSWSAVAPVDEAAAKLAAATAQKAIAEGRAAYKAAMQWNPAFTLE